MTQYKLKNFWVYFTYSYIVVVTPCRGGGIVILVAFADSVLADAASAPVLRVGVPLSVGWHSPWL